MNYIGANFQVRGSSGSLRITVTFEGKQNSLTLAVLLLYVVQWKYFNSVNVPHSLNIFTICHLRTLGQVAPVFHPLTSSLVCHVVNFEGN